MKTFKIIYTVLLLSTLISCSPAFIVQTETPTKGNFESYTTFKFFNPANLPASNFSFNETDQKTIFDAIAEEMKSRNYVSRQDAEIMIKVQGGTSSSSEIRSDSFGGPYPYDYPMYNSRYYNYGRYPYDYNRPRNESKKETTIIIDIIDIKTDKVVWQGVGIGKTNKKESFSGQTLRDAIATIFLQYPHFAGKE